SIEVGIVSRRGNQFFLCTKDKTKLGTGFQINRFIDMILPHNWQYNCCFVYILFKVTNAWRLIRFFSYFYILNNKTCPLQSKQKFRLHLKFFCNGKSGKTTQIEAKFSFININECVWGSIGSVVYTAF